MGAQETRPCDLGQFARINTTSSYSSQLPPHNQLLFITTLSTQPVAIHHSCLHGPKIAKYGRADNSPMRPGTVCSNNTICVISRVGSSLLSRHAVFPERERGNHILSPRRSRRGLHRRSQEKSYKLYIISFFYKIYIPC